MPRPTVNKNYSLIFDYILIFRAKRGILSMPNQLNSITHHIFMGLLYPFSANYL